MSGGVMTAQTIVLDTGPVIATGSSTMNFKTERVDLHLRGHLKKSRLIRLNIPLALTGPMRSPHLGGEAGHAAGQADLAALIGTVLAPIAAILPFIALRHGQGRQLPGAHCTGRNGKSRACHQDGEPLAARVVLDLALPGQEAIAVKRRVRAGRGAPATAVAGAAGKAVARA